MTKEQHNIAMAARREADRLQSITSYGGSTLGACDYLNPIVDAWVCGLKGTIPVQLIPFQTQVAKEADPEWEQYQDLKRKFE